MWARNAGSRPPLAAAAWVCAPLFYHHSGHVGICLQSSIGGTGKGIWCGAGRAGSEMAKARDRACIQSADHRGKGPAVHFCGRSRRRSNRRSEAHTGAEGKTVGQAAEITEILTEQGRVYGVKTHTGAIYSVRAAVIARGTYLAGATFGWRGDPASGPEGWRPHCS